MNPLDGWTVATGLMRANGEVVHTHLDPLTVEFVHAFPHRVEVWTIREPRLLVLGCLDDSGRFVTIEREQGVSSGTPVRVVVDLLGVDEEALA